MADKQKKMGLLERETTRRDFLKISGKGIGGTALSLSLLGLLGCSAEEASSVTAFALASGVLIADADKCSGCQRCETNCSMANDGKLSSYISRVKVSRNYNFGTDGPKISYWKENGQHGNHKMSPETCRQCAEPYCAKACPANAIVADSNTGARVVVEEDCAGCGMCREACPWDLPTIDPETNVATKCINCGECARGCPNGALSIIPWEDVKYAMRKHGYQTV